MWFIFLVAFGTVNSGLYNKKRNAADMHLRADDWENLFDWDALLEEDHNEALLGDIIDEKNLEKPGLEYLQDDLLQTAVGNKFRNYVLRTYKLQPEKDKPVTQSNPGDSKLFLAKFPGDQKGAMGVVKLQDPGTEKEPKTQGVAPAFEFVQSFFQNARKRLAKNRAQIMANQAPPERNMVLDQSGNYIENKDMNLDQNGDYTKTSGLSVHLLPSGEYPEDSPHKMPLDQDGNYVVMEKPPQ